MVAFFLGLAIFLGVIYSRLLFWDSGNLIAGWITVWGDWAVHLAYANSFLYNFRFPPVMPIFSDTPMIYPPFPDLLAAILMKFGLDITLAFNLTGFIYSLLAIIFLYRLILKISGSSKIALLTVFLYLNSGGLGFVYLFTSQKISELTRAFDLGIYWTSTLTSLLIPQRNLALGLALVFFSWEQILIFSKTNKIIHVFISVAAISLLAFTHVHSYIIAIIAFVLISMKCKYQRPLLFGLLLFSALAGILSYYGLYSSVNTSQFFRFSPGWMERDLVKFPIFAIKNYGLTLILGLLGLFIVPENIRRTSLCLLLLFVAGHLFIFQPWDWDNTKVLTYGWVGISLSAAYIFTRLPKIFAIILLILATFSGFYDNLSLLNVSKNRIILSSDAEVRAADFIKKNTPGNAVFITSDRHNHPVSMLAGRQTMMGFPGWLWSYGINIASRQADLEAFKAGDLTAISKYNVSYIYLDNSEKPLPLPFSQIYNQDGISILRVLP